MSRLKSAGAPKKIENRDQYHHGDLRRALLDAARQLAEERGIDGFTLREVARRAGVSHAAPYHHFPDKSALAEALVIETYQRLAEAMRVASEGIDGTALDRLCAIGISYVEFAAAHPAEIRLLGRFELCGKPAGSNTKEGSSMSPVEQSADAAYQVLTNTLLEGQEAGILSEDDIEHLALTCWAAVHGMSTLILDGLVDDTGLTATELASLVVRTLNKGLQRR